MYTIGLCYAPQLIKSTFDFQIFYIDKMQFLFKTFTVLQTVYFCDDLKHVNIKLGIYLSQVALTISSQSSIMFPSSKYLKIEGGIKREHFFSFWVFFTNIYESQDSREAGG